MKDLRVTEDAIRATLMDGREVSVPLACVVAALRTPRRKSGSNFEIIGQGLGVHSAGHRQRTLSAEGLLSGSPARRPAKARVAS